LRSSEGALLEIFLAFRPVLRHFGTLRILAGKRAG